MYKGLNNQVKRLKAQIQPKGFTAYFVEYAGGMYHVRESIDDTVEPLKTLTQSEYNEWEKDTNDKNTVIIQYEWAE